MQGERIREMQVTAGRCSLKVRKIWFYLEVGEILGAGCGARWNLCPWACPRSNKSRL